MLLKSEISAKAEKNSLFVLLTQKGQRIAKVRRQQKPNYFRHQREKQY